jgi:hypothetical protein
MIIDYKLNKKKKLELNNKKGKSDLSTKIYYKKNPYNFYISLTYIF